MLNNLKLNKKGISASVESAGMFLVIALMMALVLQVSIWSLTQITVKAAAYESARGGSKVGIEGAYSRATDIANSYGEGVVNFWNPELIISTSNGELIVEINQKIPVVSKLFPQATVRGVSREVIEEIA